MDEELKPGASLRRLLRERERPLVEVCVYNALTAKLAEEAGFDVIGLSGYSIAATLLAQPDAGLLTLTEVASVCSYVTRAVGAPVIADADDGYGNALNVLRTTTELIRAGAAGMTIEDQVHPKRCGHFAGKAVVSLEEAVGKVRAADHRRAELDPSFVLIARTDARGVAGGTIDDAIRRGHAFLEAGADLVFPDGLLGEAEVERCAREFPGLLCFNRIELSPAMTLPALRELGVAIVTNPDAGLLPTLYGTYEYMHRFKERDVAFQQEHFDAHRDHPLADMHRFLGFAELQEHERRFVPAQVLRDRYETAVGYGGIPQDDDAEGGS
jgi:2-methylisocitrate lyase-like PEP mutase family enzyme